jgi:glutamate-1-semialdehyde 2,1-aminomutase
MATTGRQDVRTFDASIEMAARARRVLPAGVTHDMRFLRPYPIYVERAEGAYKWDVDGNHYIDYWMGHGALLLGHRHPAVLAAVQGALGDATHAGGCHPREVEWAELVVDLLPSAERVRFTASGTEATLLAMRLARAATGRPRIVKFEGHFHGWHDYATYGVNPPFDRPGSLGIPEALDQTMSVLRPDLELVAGALSRGDVAGVILEPTGASMGLVPVDAGFLAGLRRLCDEAGAILIFDEVITAFRHAPGGVQSLTGVLPDLTALGKVLAGGLPGGAVAGRAAILDLMDFPSNGAKTSGRVPHTGTFNASPPVAAAGTTTLRLVADGEACARASALGASLREGLAEVVQRRHAPWTIIGEASVFHWLPIDAGELDLANIGGADFTAETERRKAARGPTTTEAMRNALLRRGVDFPGYEGWLSVAHSEADIEFTIAAFDDALDELGRADS